MNQQPRIAVIGGATCSEQEAMSAEAVGRLLARAGAILLTGGRGGVMEAANRSSGSGSRAPQI